MAGIYIHIPFCKKKCTYCDFHFSTTFSLYRKEMIDSICKEIVTRKSYLDNQLIETIYFGGGTPSLLSEQELLSILSTVKSNFNISDQPEITLEANPDDLNEFNLSLFYSFGINRLSIGLQSFRKDDLEWMNRAHTIEESFSCVGLAQKVGFNNISIDLIYGLPNLSLDEWEKTIDTALNLNVQHISAYCLTVENKTALKKLVTEKKIVVSDEDQQSDQFELLVNKLSDSNFFQYEISNFSKANFESKHNSNYWKGEHYLGVGPSAHSFNTNSRSWNIANNKKYIHYIQSDLPSFETEFLSRENLFNELIMIGLRTSYGVDLNKLNQIIQLDLSFDSKLQNFINESLIIKIDNIIQLTDSGKLQADYIASMLFRE